MGWREFLVLIIEIGYAAQGLDVDTMKEPISNHNGDELEPTPSISTERTEDDEQRQELNPVIEDLCQSGSVMDFKLIIEMVIDDDVPTRCIIKLSDGRHFNRNRL